MKQLLSTICFVSFGLILTSTTNGQQNLSETQLQKLLNRFPGADANGDGVLSNDEFLAARDKFRAPRNRNRRGGVKRDFKAHPGWDLDRFPDDAVCYKSPEEIKALFAKVKTGKQPAVASFPKPKDGALRIVGIGHSFMMPGYKTLPLISRGAGMTQPLYTHVGGGMKGSARYKWEQENGIFQFEGKPLPKLLAAIANAEWDAMMFGPYFKDRPVYYSCWIDFCLKHNPEMKFYISDAWPQLAKVEPRPTSEDYFTEDVINKLGKEKRENFTALFESLAKAYPGKVFVVPTSDAMVLAAKQFVRGELPGIEGLHRVIGKQERSLWKDQIGHLGPGLERLEGYVFYSTLYGRSPERIDQKIKFGGNSKFPSDDLDQIFRNIAWQAVKEHPNTGVTDKNGDGLNDSASKVWSQSDSNRQKN